MAFWLPAQARKKQSQIDFWVQSFERPSCWEILKAGGEGNDRGWDGWMASPTQWTWVWASSRSWWWTGKPAVLQSMGLQSWTRLSDWAELNWIHRKPTQFFIFPTKMGLFGIRRELTIWSLQVINMKVEGLKDCLKWRKYLWISNLLCAWRRLLILSGYEMGHFAFFVERKGWWRKQSQCPDSKSESWRTTFN